MAVHKSNFVICLSSLSICPYIQTVLQKLNLSKMSADDVLANGHVSELNKLMATWYTNVKDHQDEYMGQNWDRLY